MLLTCSSQYREWCECYTHRTESPHSEADIHVKSTPGAEPHPQELLSLRRPRTFHLRLLSRESHLAAVLLAAPAGDPWLVLTHPSACDLGAGAVHTLHVCRAHLYRPEHLCTGVFTVPQIQSSQQPWPAACGPGFGFSFLTGFSSFSVKQVLNQGRFVPR